MKKEKTKRTKPRISFSRTYPKCIDCGWEFPLLKALGLTKTEPMRCAICQKKFNNKQSAIDRIQRRVVEAIEHGDLLRMATWGRTI